MAYGDKGAAGPAGGGTSRGGGTGGHGSGRGNGGEGQARGATGRAGPSPGQLAEGSRGARDAAARGAFRDGGEAARGRQQQAYGLSPGQQAMRAGPGAITGRMPEGQGGLLQGLSSFFGDLMPDNPADALKTGLYGLVPGAALLDRVIDKVFPDAPPASLGPASERGGAEGQLNRGELAAMAATGQPPPALPADGRKTPEEEERRPPAEIAGNGVHTSAGVPGPVPVRHGTHTWRDRASG